MGGLKKDETKEAVKEGVKEFLDEKFTAFGKWSLGAILAVALSALTYFIFWANGWHK